MNNFQEKFFSGFTIIPNQLFLMKQNNEIDWIEFMLICNILAYKNISAHKTSIKKIASEVNERFNTVSKALNSLESKGFIKIIKINDWHRRIDCFIEVGSTFKISKDPQYSIEIKEEVKNDGGVVKNDGGVVKNDGGVVKNDDHRSNIIEIKNKNNSLSNSCELAVENNLKIKEENTTKSIVCQKEQMSEKEKPNLNPSAILEIYNKIVEQKGCILKKALKLNNTRKKHILKTTNELFKTFREWSRYFLGVHESAFLIGNQSGFRASFDWLINPSNALKVLEGNYHHRRR